MDDVLYLKPRGTIAGRRDGGAPLDGANMVTLVASANGSVVTLYVNGEPTIWDALAAEIGPWADAQIER